MNKRTKVIQSRSIDLCNLAAGFVAFVSIGFAALGVISDAFNISLVLEPTSWLLLAIVAALDFIATHMIVVTAKHLYGIESEIKKEQ